MSKKFDVVKLKKIYKTVLSYAFILLGNFGLAVGVEIFVVPCGLVMGGVTGLGQFIHHFLSWFPLSAFTFSFNMAMLILGFIILGKKFTLTTILSSVAYPAFMALLEIFYDGTPITDNKLLASLFAGATIGFSIGLVARCGASTGGVDIPALIISKYTGISFGTMELVMDVIVFAFLFFISNVETMLYALILTVVQMFSIDKVIYIGNKKAQMKIISDEYLQIRDKIVNEWDLGVTVLFGETGYLKEPVHMLISVMNSREVTRIKKLVEEIDPTAFIMISEVREVRGRGFSIERKML